MGTALLRAVARRRQEKKPLSDWNNNLELGECAFNSKELLLLESPPLGVLHKKTSECVTQSVKIGKLARVPERKIVDEQVDLKVSQRLISLNFNGT